MRYSDDITIDSNKASILGVLRIVLVCKGFRVVFSIRAFRSHSISPLAAEDFCAFS